jgi:hypothetical protein
VTPKTRGHGWTIGGLAASIYDALVDPTASKDSPAVLAIGASWDRELGGSALCRPPAVAAAHDVLRVASCHDVLVLAAPGDRLDGRAPSKAARYPAGWASLQAPDAASCSTLLGETVAALPKRPLLHAVGDVQGTGKQLSTSLRDVRPLLSAYGDLTAWKLSSLKYRAASGSPVAVTVAAASAAAVRYYRPSLSAPQVAGLLQSSGDLLGHKASLCLGGTSVPACKNQPARRVSLCRAVQQACKPPSERCPTTPFSCPAWNKALPVSPAALQQYSATVYSTPAPVQPAKCVGPGGDCPHLKYAGRTMLRSGPELPENPPNPAFMELYNGHATLYVDTWGYVFPENPTLVFRTELGESFVELGNLTSAGSGVFNFRGRAVLQCVALVEQGLESAMLAYEHASEAGRESVIVPLFIYMR